MKSFTSAASAYLEVSSEIDRQYTGDEAIRHRVRPHLPSVQIESRIKDKTQRHLGAFLVALIVAIIHGIGKGGRPPLWIAVALLAIGMMLPWLIGMSIR